MISGCCAPTPAKGAKPPLNPEELGMPQREWKGLRPWFWGSKGVKPLCWGLGTEGPQVKLVQGGV